MGARTPSDPAAAGPTGKPGNQRPTSPSHHAEWSVVLLSGIGTKTRTSRGGARWPQQPGLDSARTTRTGSRRPGHPHRINRLIDNALRDLSTCIGKPEPLRHILAGAWSRRISDEHRPRLPRRRRRHPRPAGPLPPHVRLLRCRSEGTHASAEAPLADAWALNARPREECLHRRGGATPHVCGAASTPGPGSAPPGSRPPRRCRQTLLRRRPGQPRRTRAE
jgi:hypothetical protein